MFLLDITNLKNLDVESWNELLPMRFFECFILEVPDRKCASLFAPLTDIFLLWICRVPTRF